MARPRRQVYTMKQYLDNLNEGYISNDADTQRNPAWQTIVDGLGVTIETDESDLANVWGGIAWNK